jgi:hypothetical protein
MNQEVIDISCIQHYNRLIAVMANKRVSGMTWEGTKALRESAPLLKFTLGGKQVGEKETEFFNYLLKICKELKATYLSIMSDGIAFYFERNVVNVGPKEIYDKLSNIIAEGDLHSTNTTIVPTVPGRHFHGPGKCTITHDKIFNDKFYITELSLHTHISSDDTFFSVKSLYYGLYNVQTGAKVATKRDQIVKFLFSLGFLSKSCRQTGAHLTFGMSDLRKALEFLHAVKPLERSPYRQAAALSMQRELRYVRWPDYSSVKAILDQYRR